MIKKIIVISMLVAVLSTILTFPVIASNPDIKLIILINEKELKIPENNGTPFLDTSGRTQVPLRVLVEGLGYKVNWDDDTQTATIPCKNGSVRLKIGESVVHTPRGDIQMDTQAFTKDGRTYVPLRFVSESLGFSINLVTEQDYVPSHLTTFRIRINGTLGTATKSNDTASSSNAGSVKGATLN